MRQFEIANAVCIQSHFGSRSFIHHVNTTWRCLVLKQATVIWSAATCRRFAFPKRHFCQSAWENIKESVSISGEVDHTHEHLFQSQIT